uniref:Uncharacterized protein ORF109 n=1 Tax=Phaeoceros laevis TaxID=37308 RepID=D3J0K8_9EMBR|nr:hypothetical protein PhlaMp41 [Phaeoceros laevis]ACT75322.1 hypothetical protein PhlaMp41 [Phaeoceros laevis]
MARNSHFWCARVNCVRYTQLAGKVAKHVMVYITAGASQKWCATSLCLGLNSSSTLKAYAGKTRSTCAYLGRQARASSLQSSLEKLQYYNYVPIICEPLYFTCKIKISPK